MSATTLVVCGSTFLAPFTGSTLLTYGCCCAGVVGPVVGGVVGGVVVGGAVVGGAVVGGGDGWPGTRGAK